MKKIKSLIPYILMLAMLLALIPAASLRLAVEKSNNNVIMSLYYNDLYNKVSPKKQQEMLDAYKAEGITLLSVTEEDVNSMIAKGALTCIKFNVLKHKYDQESIDIATHIETNYPELSYDCYLLMTKYEDTKEKLDQWIPAKYTEDEFMMLESYKDMHLYAYLDGRQDLWNVSLGFNEDTIAMLKDQGFDIALVHKVKNYQKTDYLAEIDRLVKTYDVQYFNIKEDGAKFNDDQPNEKNPQGIADIITNNNLTLLLTENTDQLSNQKCVGYQLIFDQVMEKGTKKVLRSYETYDDSQSDDTFYSHRVEQFFNSTIDRNIRFVMITQLAPKGEDYETLSELTLTAAKEYKEKIEAVGFTVGSEPAPYDYTASTKVNAALAAVIMVMMLLVMVEALFACPQKFTWLALVLAVFAFSGTFVLPQSLLSLYATAFAGLLPCFCVTMVFLLVKKLNKKLPTLAEVPLVVLFAVAVMCLGGMVTGSLLSGLPYYINNQIFRGIKITLLLPLAYSAVAFYCMFIKTDKKSLLLDLKTLLCADIKVYWMLLAAVVGAVGVYYIIRSGNVNEISSFEKTLRSTVTDIFPHRPRTKEFLLGYPALVLFVYYMRNTDVKLLQWLLAVASSILVASVSNSFCHVFTNLTTIYMRVVNGLLLGAVISLAVYIGNLILVCIAKKIAAKLKD